MRKISHKILSFGIRKNYSAQQIEKTKLINGISFIGVPICFFYLTLFALMGYNFHAVVFFFGAIIFGSTLLFNKLFGLSCARIYISIFGPACFGYVNFISGIETGFYMGFIVTTIPALLVFDNTKQSFIYVIISLMLLTLSMIGACYIAPVVKIEYAIVLLVINLFTVIMATLTVVFIFKQELQESKDKIEEKQKEILDSIHYAKRIQQALLPNEKYLERIFTSIKDNVTN